MEDLRFYNFEFVLLAVEHDIISVNWKLRYNTFGSFEAHFSIFSGIVPVLMHEDNKYIVVVQGGKQAIITAKQLGEEFVLYGRTLNFILSKRLTPNFSSQTGGAEALARGYVSDAFSDVDNFVLGPLAGLDEEITFWRNVYNPTVEVVRDCLKRVSGGFKVEFDRQNEQWVFSVIKGVQRSILISDENLNAYETSYAEDLEDYACCGYYQHGEAEESEQAQAEWVFIEKDASAEGIYRWEAKLGSLYESEAINELSKCVWEKEIRTKTRGLKYLTDYNLGDVLSVEIKKGSFKTRKQNRVLGVNIWQEYTDSGEIPIFKEEE